MDSDSGVRVASAASRIPQLSRLPRPLPAKSSTSQLPTPSSRLQHAPSRESLKSKYATATSTNRAPSPISGRRTLTTKTSTSTLRRPATGSTRHISRKSSKQDLSSNATRDLPSQDSAGVADEEAGNTSIVAELQSEETSQNSRQTRKPRQSLAERTVETLQSIPSSPAVRRRRSSFFNNMESPISTSSYNRPPSRPGSACQYNPSMRPPSRTSTIRPPSSDSGMPHVPDFRASTSSMKPAKSHVPITPTKSSSNTSTNNPRSTYGQVSQTGPIRGTKTSSATPQGQSAKPKAATVRSRVSLANRSIKPRASLNGLFAENVERSQEQQPIQTSKVRQDTRSRIQPSNTSSASSDRKSITPPTSDGSEPTPRKTSLALRDQIAKAKAARRASNRHVSSTSKTELEVAVVPTDAFDFGLSDIPFSHGSKGDNGGLLRKRIAAARGDGKLNIAAMDLTCFPDEVMNMYSLESIGDGSWAETVDLTRLVAADNLMERIEDSIFPDTDPRESTGCEDSPGNQFGGLEALDMHGNVLSTLPMGLRRLERLTILNLVRVYLPVKLPTNLHRHTTN